MLVGEREASRRSGGPFAAQEGPLIGNPGRQNSHAIIAGREPNPVKKILVGVTLGVRRQSEIDEVLQPYGFPGIIR